MNFYPYQPGQYCYNPYKHFANCRWFLRNEKGRLYFFIIILLMCVDELFAGWLCNTVGYKESRSMLKKSVIVHGLLRSVCKYATRINVHPYHMFAQLSL